jgi:hypothetical protein
MPTLPRMSTYRVIAAMPVSREFPVEGRRP